MPTTNELRRHVFDDALELAAITGMLVPLLDVELSTDEIDHAPLRFFRQHLARHLALVVTRLHEAPRDDGRTGATASIAALLEKAREEGRLSPQLFETFTKGLERIKSDFTAKGGNWDELRDFRHSELAHSLHRHLASDRLLFSPVWDLAHDTFELVAAMERYLDQTGLDSMVLQNRFDIWRDRGVEFWSSHATYARCRK